MDASLYDGLFTNGGLPIVVMLIGLPILFCFLFPVVCLAFGAIGALLPIFFAAISLIFHAIFALFNALQSQPKLQMAQAEVVAKNTSTKRPQKQRKAAPKKTEKPKYTDIEMDVVHGLKGLGLTIKDAKQIVKKVNIDDENLDVVSLMNKCLEAIKSR